MNQLHDCVIVLDRPKSPENVGMILRSALALCGPEVSVLVCAPRWPLDRFPLDRLKTDTNKAAKHLDVRVVARLADALKQITEMVLVVIERGLPGSEFLDEYTHPRNAAYIFGPEDGSVDAFDLPAERVEIGGARNLPDRHQGCLNLATAVSIVLYDRAAKHAF